MEASRPVPDLLDLFADDEASGAAPHVGPFWREAETNGWAVPLGQLAAAASQMDEPTAPEAPEDESVLTACVQEWADGKNIRALLASVQDVAPPGMWTERKLGDLLDARQLRSAYRAALLTFHPDKLPPRHKILGQLVLNALLQSWSASKRQ